MVHLLLPSKLTGLFVVTVSNADTPSASVDTNFIVAVAVAGAFVVAVESGQCF